MSRRASLRTARWLFAVATLVFAWWSFRGRWDDVAGALVGVGPGHLVVAAAAAGLGLGVTARLWRLLLRWIGPDIGAHDAAAVFLVGQLGKYVPGSVWSVAVQARLGRRHGVPVRWSVTASSLFLLVHTATGLLLGGLLVLSGALPNVSYAVAATAAVVGAVALAPPLVRRVADRFSGHRTRFGLRELGVAGALMLVVWACYGVTVLALVPASSGASGTPLFAAAVAAFALAHAVGVLVVLAPAGVGAREGVLIALLAPMLGVPGAAATSLLARVVHVVADFVVAGLAAWWASRGGRRTTLEVREPARADRR